MVSLIVVKMFIAPSHALDTRIVAEKSKIASAQRTLAQQGMYHRTLHQVAARCFATSTQATSEALRARLVDLVGKAGLNEQAIQLTPQNGRRVPHVMQSVGWSVSVKGPLDSIVRFLYSAQHMPRVHRIEDLILIPVPRSNHVALRFKCMTLVLDSSKGLKLVAPRPDKDLAAAPLTKPVLAGYDRAVARDIFLPAIIQKPQPREVAATSPKPVPERITTRILGLPRWGGQSEVLVHRSDQSATHVYHVGDTLAGGKIIGVDYRPMPRPNDPTVISQSRVLIQIHHQTWAVELGDTLNQKHRVARADLPQALARTSQKTPHEHADH